MALQKTERSHPVLQNYNLWGN